MEKEDHPPWLNGRLIQQGQKLPCGRSSTGQSRYIHQHWFATFGREPDRT